MNGLRERATLIPMDCEALSHAWTAILLRAGNVQNGRHGAEERPRMVSLVGDWCASLSLCLCYGLLYRRDARVRTNYARVCRCGTYCTPDLGISRSGTSCQAV